MLGCSLKKYIAFLLVFLFSFFQVATCFAGFSMMECPLTPPIIITSPYGYRPDVSVSASNFHYGIDMCSETEDQGVYAVADGVIAYAGEASGYGLAIVIEHTGVDGQPFYATYGDLSDIEVYYGVVASGTRIGTYGIGPGQSSTGDHLHFQISIGSFFQHGDGIDPQYWAVYAPWLEGDYSNTQHRGGSALAKFEAETFLAFTDEIQKIIDTFAEACVKGIKLITGIVYTVIGILMVIDFAMTYILDSIDQEKLRSPSYSIFKILILKSILYLFLFFFITHWGLFVGDSAKSLFVTLGGLTSGVDAETAAKTVSNPMFIISKGAHIIAPLFDVLNNASSFRLSLDFIVSFVKAIPVFFFIIVILVCFVLFAYQICIAYLEFFFTILFSFSNFMWAGLKQTRRYASNGVGAIFCVSAKLFFFIFFALMMQNVIQTMEIEDLVHEVDDGVGGHVNAHPDGDFGSVEEFAKATVIVESSGRYDVYNDGGSGAYGAYQQMPEYWDGHCRDYESAYPGEHLCLRDAGDSPDNAPNTYYGWCKENQDKVSLYMMHCYFEEGGGNYRYIAERWLGADSDDYWGKLCAANGDLLPGGKHKEISFIACLKVTLFAMLFLIIADKIGTRITDTWGRGGFVFIQE